MIQIKEYESFSWIDVYNPDTREVKKIKNEHNLAFNVIEDSMESGHIPKFEKIKDYTFIILRAYTGKNHEIIENISHISGKIAFFVNDKKIITIHNSQFSFLENLEYRNLGAYGLMLDIIKLMMESFSEPLSKLTAKMDILEKEIFVKNGSKLTAETLYKYKSTAQTIKRIVQFSQHVLSQLTVAPELQSNLQDIKETVVDNQIEAEEIVDDALTLLDVYLSISSQRSNDIMKLLTVFSAFFLPLTFITGLYGMNFANIPGIQAPLGFFVILGVMVIMSLMILLWFKIKKIL